MPVEMPSRASIETVKAVPNGVSLRSLIGRSWSASQRSSVRQRQIRPRPWVAMNVIASGVANCAAMVRSPSFSRSAASTTTTNLPCRMSSIASSTVANAAARSVASISRIVVSGSAQTLRVLRQQVDLDVQAVAGLRASQRRVLERERHERDLYALAAQRRDRQRDAVDRERALLDAVAQEARVEAEAQAGAVAFAVERLDLGRAVDVALDEVPAERLACAQRRLEVDLRAG